VEAFDSLNTGQELPRACAQVSPASLSYRHGAGLAPIAYDQQYGTFVTAPSRDLGLACAHCDRPHVDGSPARRRAAATSRA